MQKLTKEELGGYSNEFEAAKSAQDGNTRAWMLLWKHYKAMIMAQVRHVKGLSREELESEAVVLFAHKLALFDRKKVTKADGYSLHSWLYLGAINLTNRLIRQRKREVHLYNEQVSAAHSLGGGGKFFGIAIC
jgi:DNA-directed RNA polymerase specialized sigma24 family protein